jgi:hypothetical protein
MDWPIYLAYKNLFPSQLILNRDFVLKRAEALGIKIFGY